MEEYLNKLKQALYPVYGKGESDAIVRLIFHYLKGWSLTDMLIHRNEPLSPFIKGEIDKIIPRLLNFEPIQYITGETRFHGLELNVKPGVLIPRQETSELVDLIVDENSGRDDLSVLDLCTGSGAIAVALARYLPFSKVYAVDFSKDAIEVAEGNIKKLKVNVNLLEADIFSDSFLTSLSGDSKNAYDIIVSNPPYVMDKEALTMEKNVLDYEPHEAIFVRDDNPLVFYSRIADIALKSLKLNGKLYFEINPLTSLELQNLLKAKGFADITVRKDSFGKDRFLSCTIA